MQAEFGQTQGRKLRMHMCPRAQWCRHSARGGGVARIDDEGRGVRRRLHRVVSGDAGEVVN
eukprot:4335358-Pleurochrysis_carterae.AAC.1